MKRSLCRVDQSDLREDINDSFSACVASILGKKLSDVPHFAKMADAGKGTFWELVSDYLASIGYTYKYSIRPCFTAIAIGKSPRSGERHNVVWNNGRISHDPHPSRMGLDGRPSGWIVLIPGNYPYRCSI